jgi:hypothetical protein
MQETRKSEKRTGESAAKLRASLCAAAAGFPVVEEGDRVVNLAGNFGVGTNSWKAIVNYTRPSVFAFINDYMIRSQGKKLWIPSFDASDPKGGIDLMPIEAGPHYMSSIASSIISYAKTLEYDRGKDSWYSSKAEGMKCVVMLRWLRTILYAGEIMIMDPTIPFSVKEDEDAMICDLFRGEFKAVIALELAAASAVGGSMLGSAPIYEMHLWNVRENDSTGFSKYGKSFEYDPENGDKAYSVMTETDGVFSDVSNLQSIYGTVLDGVLLKGEEEADPSKEMRIGLGILLRFDAHDTGLHGFPVKASSSYSDRYSPLIYAVLSLGKEGREEMAKAQKEERALFDSAYKSFPKDDKDHLDAYYSMDIFSITDAVQTLKAGSRVMESTLMRISDDGLIDLAGAMKLHYAKRSIGDIPARNLSRYYNSNAFLYEAVYLEALRRGKDFSDGFEKILGLTPLDRLGVIESLIDQTKDIAISAADTYDEKAIWPDPMARCHEVKAVGEAIEGVFSNDLPGRGSEYGSVVSEDQAYYLARWLIREAYRADSDTSVNFNSSDAALEYTAKNGKFADAADALISSRFGVAKGTIKSRIIRDCAKVPGLVDKSEAIPLPEAALETFADTLARIKIGNGYSAYPRAFGGDYDKLVDPDSDVTSSASDIYSQTLGIGGGSCHPEAKANSADILFIALRNAVVGCSGIDAAVALMRLLISEMARESSSSKRSYERIETCLNAMIYYDSPMKDPSLAKDYLIEIVKCLNSPRWPTPALSPKAVQCILQLRKDVRRYDLDYGNPHMLGIPFNDAAYAIRHCPEANTFRNCVATALLDSRY